MASIIPKTRDNERVQALADVLDEIPEFAGAPQLPRLTTESNETDYDDINFAIEEVRGTSFDDHVHDIIDWLDGFTGKVNIDNQLRVEVEHDKRFISVVGLAYRTSHFSPYSLHFRCFADGRVKVRLRVRPLGNQHARENRERFDVYDGLAEEFDPADARDQLASHQPYVTSRIAELHRWHGVNRSEARVMALRELGMSNDDITDRLGGVSNSTTRSYVSKFNDYFDEAEGLFVARAGTPKRVLSKQEFDGQAPGHTMTRYVCQSIREDDADPEMSGGPIWMITIDEQSAGFPEGAGLNVSSERFRSVDALITAKYDGQEFDARQTLQAWKKLFTNIDEDLVGEAVHDRVDEAQVMLAG